MQRYVNINQLWSHAITDELVRCGVRHAVISPGSRNTPLVLALAAHPDITDHSVIDERSAAFFALGLAKASGQPVALLCTSGTAAANYFPAVCEADASCVPLLLLTADRPASMRDSGAPQAMDQIKLYGERVRWFMDAGAPEADEPRLRALRSSVCHAFEMAMGSPAGPVHINLPFRKPLEPIPADKMQDQIPDALLERGAEAIRGRSDGRPWTRVFSASRNDGALEEIADALLSARRPVILAGPHANDAKHAAELLRIAALHGIPVFAEAASQLRVVEEHSLRYSTLDLLLRSEAFRDAFQPDVILQLGGVPTNAAVQRFLEEAQAEHLCIAADRSRKDAAHTVRLHAVDEQGDFLKRLCEFLSRCPAREADAGFLRNIRKTDSVIRKMLTEQFDAMPGIFEGAVMHRLSGLLPAHSAVFVSSSMPIRDVESFALQFPQGTKLYFNRGVNGIDGIVSTALGMARVSGNPSLLITGDISFLHNLNAAAGAGLSGIPLTVLLINNDGGEIFDMLPVRDFDPAYTRHFTTPHGVDFASACAAFGIGHCVVAQLDEMNSALGAAFSCGRMSVVEVRTSISESGDLRRALLRELAAAVDAGLSEVQTNEQSRHTGREHFPLAWRILAQSAGQSAGTPPSQLTAQSTGQPEAQSTGQSTGQSTAEPVLLLHGFTRSSASWIPLIGRLPGINAIGIDLMGHGASPAPDPAAHFNVYGLDHAAEQLRGIITRLGLGKVHLVGYSLGGRTALHFASRHPELLRSLALISSNPGIEDEAERSLRREADAELALRIEHIGLEEFAAEWSGGPLFAAQRELDPAAWREAQNDRLSRQSRGLQGALLGSGQGAQLPLWDALPGLDIPVLVAAGANDGRYAEIAQRMHAALPQAELRVYPEAGHDLLFERSAELAMVLQDLWKR
ncbi:MAG: 2-succinyl-5-enolpyruvyl-6-hydroxy-3-cyclohexene-1-carboxylic-acid synthase [Bacteroidota bacterium]